MKPVTVAIPVLNGGPLLAEVLAAVRGQRVDREVELLVADSGSRDGSAELARRHGATVLDVPAGTFSHGGTRNLMVERAAGAHVVFLSQDAVPSSERWLARLLDGFELGDDVALVFGPYIPRPEASPMVRRELEQWFESFSPNGEPRVDRGEADGDERARRRARYFTDANGCIARWAWDRVPFRDVAYAEDIVLARDVLEAGYSKAYHPGAAVVHSHDYSPMRLLRRAFDESRALHDARGDVAPGGPAAMSMTVQRHVRDDIDYLRDQGSGGALLAGAAARSIAHHGARAVGAALGSRADRLPGPLRRSLSLEGRH